MFATGPENCPRPCVQRHSFAHGSQQDQRGAHQASWAECFPWCMRATPHSGRDHGARACQGSNSVFQRSQNVCGVIDGSRVEVPLWGVLRENTAVRADALESSEPKFGWQQKATRRLHQKFHEEHWPGLSNPERALMLSQRGLLASVIFFHGGPHQQDDEDRSSTFSTAPVTVFQIAPSLDLTHLPMWPPTRLFWPSSSSVQCGVVFGGRGFPLEQAAHRCAEKQGRE